MAIEAEAHPTIPADWGRAVAAKVAREIRGACGRMADRHAFASDEIDDACDAAVTAVMQVLAEAFTAPDLIHRSALAEDTARAAEGWEPIEGAPRNELILIGRYSDGKWDAQTFIIEDANWREDFDWIDDEPTHWMRLPAPPALPRIKGGSHGE